MLMLFADAAANSDPANWIAIGIAAVAAVSSGWQLYVNRLEKKDKLSHDTVVVEMKVELAECKTDRTELRDRVERLEKLLGVPK